MITIEAVSLRKGGWRRHSETILSDLRHLDPKVGTVIFFAVVTAVMFYMYFSRSRTIVSSAISTASSVGILAVVFSLAFGIDLVGAIGGINLMPML